MLLIAKAIQPKNRMRSGFSFMFHYRRGLFFIRGRRVEIGIRWNMLDNLGRD
jgi:hypothetical protein